MVKSLKDKFGLNQSLAIIGLPKKTWYYQQKKKIDWEQKYQAVKNDLLLIAKQYPDYGYKRAATELREAYGYQINEKTVLKLTRDYQLQLLRKVKKPKPELDYPEPAQNGEQDEPCCLKTS